MRFDLRDLSIGKIILDPNNYRFYDLALWRVKQRQRYHDESVQEASLRLLERTPRYNIAELRQSILANGYVPLERVVVVPHEFSRDTYLLVEGNRRVAALKTLLRDNTEGVLTLTEEQVSNFTTIPVAFLDPEDEGLIAAERILMGIRHIAGPQEWGAYQQAFLIWELVDEEGQQFDDIARHLGLSLIETRRRYRAIRALKKMQSDELYSGVAKPEFYRLFHDLVSVPNVREFFSWDHDSAQFNDEERARQFFELIEPLESDFGAKLRTYADVRQLRSVIGNPTAEAILLDPDQPLAAALTVVQPDNGAQTAQDLSSEVSQFYELLQTAQIEALTSLSVEDLRVLEEIANLINARLEQYSRLAA